jgi:hypothetical protein
LRGLVAWGGRPNRSRITYWIGGTKLKQQRRRANATDERRAALFRALPACQPQLRWQTRPRPRPNIVRGPAAYHHPKHYRQTLTSWHAFTCRTRPPHVSYVTRLKPRRVLVRSILQTPRTDSSIGCYSCSLPSGHFSARRAHEDLCCKMLLRCGPRKPCKRATRQFRKQNGTRKHINSSLFFNERNHRVRVRMFMCKSRLCGYISSSLFFDKINYHDFCYLTKRHLHNRTNFKKKQVRMWDVRMCQHLHKTDAAWTWHVPSSGSNFFFRKKEFEPVLIFDAGSAPVPADRCICAACDMRGYDAVANSRIRITVTNCAVCYPLYPTVLIPFYIVFFPRRITSIRHILCLLERKKKRKFPELYGLL